MSVRPPLATTDRAGGVGMVSPPTPARAGGSGAAAPTPPPPSYGDPGAAPATDGEGAVAVAADQQRGREAA